ncbi:hypothetical protein [Spongiactinospora sp. TRM90649]|uniref:hypothetical protein n=1 Tax=Spongiactinospora sp. TRM90649 TaxID=3031114 RepID=UPI0023F634B4|nr:hypothetical protein [Spongiactinospora sp. TRM90649]MDF5757341.1 hypothetical protein [Spongiactinospora sp. TRM90649]
MLAGHDLSRRATMSGASGEEQRQEQDVVDVGDANNPAACPMVLTFTVRCALSRDRSAVSGWR